MSTIANLIVRLAADFGDTSSKMREVGDAAHKMGEEADGAGHHVDDLAHHAHESGEGLGEMQEKLLDFGKEMALFGVETLGVAGAFETLKESMEVYAEIESVTVAMTQFTGSAEAAGEVIEGLEGIAKSEALAFPSILASAQHFMALGFSAEQTARSMQVAGNAAWALGTSVESVSQRMGMMAMGGQVSGRFLRSLGISLEDLANVMGVTGKNTADLEDKVRRAFKFETEEERLHALQDAMDKFAGLGTKEADTLKGKWIEMMNSMHVAFATIGSDLSEAAGVVLSAVTGMIDALTALLDKLDIVKNVKATVQVGPLTYIDDKGKAQKSLTREDLAKPKESLGIPGTGGALAPDVKAAAADRSGKPQLQKDLDDAEAAKRALAESNAGQDYARRKTEIDAEAAHDKAMLEVARSYYKSLAAEHLMGANELVEREKSLNDMELSIALDAVNRKKAVETSSKGMKEEDKDATLDAQAASARDKNMAANAALDNREAERRAKLTDSIVKEGEKRVVKEHEMNDKLLAQLEKFALDDAAVWRRLIDDENKSALEKAETAAKSATGATRDTAASAQESNKSARLALERSYGLEATRTLAQEVDYRRQIGVLEAASLDIKARQAAAEAGIARELADKANAQLDVASTEEQVKKAADLTLKAHDDDLKVMEAQAAAADARYETETKILELIKQRSILGELQSQITSAGESIPGSLGGAIASGVTHEGKGGMDVGKQVAEAMRGIGKQIFGDVLTAAIKQLIVSIGLQTLATNAMHLIFGTTAATQTVATATNTVATAANTVALATSTAVMVAGGAAEVALLTSIDAGVWALFLKPSFLGTTFDTGGPVSHDMIAMVHKGEHVLNPDQVRGLAPLPDIPGLRSYASGGNPADNLGSYAGVANSNAFTTGDIHVHGARDAEALARQLPDVLKNRFGGFSPYSK